MLGVGHEREINMDTYFAPAERSNNDELLKEIEIISKNPIIDGLLNSVSGLLAVLNEHRQILTLNHLLLEILGIGDAENVLGLRPGEALKCVHSCEMPGGCGTSKFCSTCGAAISIVTSLATDAPVEKECAITTEELDKKRDLFFRVRCVPMHFNSKRFLLLFLQDITYHQRLAALEKTFFHDINGIINGLVNGIYLINQKSKDENIKDIVEIIYRLSSRLASEVAVQRCLSQTEACVYQPTFTSFSIANVFQEIKDIFSNHPAKKNKTLLLPKEFPDISIKTEPSLLIRVLNNMVTNALEETIEGDEVRMWVETSQERITFSVWNRKNIPADIAKRIFQRNFSTKLEYGRGLGTYSMKLFGEDILGGRVDFTTSEKEGTIFRFSLRIKS